jgi:hypothetical protein
MIIRFLDKDEASEFFFDSDGIVVKEIFFAEQTLVVFHFRSVVLEINSLLMDFVTACVLDVLNLF